MLTVLEPLHVKKSDYDTMRINEINISTRESIRSSVLFSCMLPEQSARAQSEPPAVRHGASGGCDGTGHPLR